MKVLTFTTLYPNAERPQFGVFVENRLRHLINDYPVESRVVAPVPWFPLKNARFGSYSRFARVPGWETRHGIEIVHPRFIQIPKIGMSISPLMLALAARPVLERIRHAGFDFDIIDAHYFYPDGVAAAILGAWFKRPVVITARGSDLNVLSKFRVPRRMIQWAAHKADAVVTVCQALKNVLTDLAVPDDKIFVLRNGVDLKQFTPSLERDTLRAQLGMHRRTLLAVGGLIELKGHYLVIEALKELPDTDLVIIGDGPDKKNLNDLCQRMGVEKRVRIMGSIPHEQLRHYYAAADALVLASSREGWANVLLESMACGTPVVATDVSGNPEVVAAPEAGILISSRTSTGIAEGVVRLFSQLPPREATRRYAERFDWHTTSQGQYKLFSRIRKPNISHV